MIYLYSTERFWNIRSENCRIALIKIYTISRHICRTFKFFILTWFRYFFRALTTSTSMVHLPKDPVTQHCFFHLGLLMMQTSKKDFYGSKKTNFFPVGRKGSLFLPRTTFIASKKEILVLLRWEALYSRLDFNRCKILQKAYCFRYIENCSNLLFILYYS